MADATHLERMGRELKCPICLSLLSSAVSLTCNHVFCNACIDKSMKSASNCPVCKVPYMRREIRAAPHMDNLVSVYKSMEVASGVNIFVTQTAVSTKIPGEDIQTGVDIHKVHDNGKTEAKKLDYANQRQRKKKGPKRASVSSTQRSSQSNLEKPSFPTKKRVQVPQYQTSRVQIEHENMGCMIGETDRKEPEKDTHFTCEKGKPALSPFFWLRDEDEDDSEKLCLQTDDNQVMYTPPDVPCFSDIKDSDNVFPSPINQEGEKCELTSKADFVDSEMFDWTQRPCSPELCSSPLSMRVEDTAEENGAQEKVEAALTKTITEPKICLNKRKRLDKERTDQVYENIIGVRTSKCNATAIRKGKRANESMCEVTAVLIESDEVSNQGVREGKTGSTNKKIKTKCFDARIQRNNIPNRCVGTEPLLNRKELATSHVSTSENIEKSSNKSRKLNKRGKSHKSTIKKLPQPVKFCTENGYMITESQNEAVENGCMIKETQNETFIPKSHTNSLSLDKGITRNSKEKSSKILKSLKEVKFSVERTSKDNCNGVSLNDDNEGVMRCQMAQDSQDVIDQLGVKIPAKMNKAISSSNGGVLHKCNTSNSTFCCAFCQSSDESETTGSMVHYLNGKLVADIRYARTDAIHVHKNCTEWAPNVYFEDDNVINLETELSRSRRIKCCCCGIKGAALGCYDKSCRKSFHITCARLTPECRWDYENFVMLCPIHASCQLPNETSQSQSRQKKKSVAERKSSIHQTQIADEYKICSTTQWISQRKFKNFVLCCSALTKTEKEIVTRFENMSGLTVLKKWKPTVTHVITSTDENGACRRTLKYLMGVLEGKWILNVEWIKACIGAGDLVDELSYEISIDIHGIRDGPRLGRLRLLNKQAKLFEGYTFYFTGDFGHSYKGYLHDLVISAGGKILNRKPVAIDHVLSPVAAKTIIIYSIELPDKSSPSNGELIINQRRAHAEALARSSGAIVASSSWILNSVGGYKLQEIGD